MNRLYIKSITNVVITVMVDNETLEDVHKQINEIWRQKSIERFEEYRKEIEELKK